MMNEHDYGILGFPGKGSGSDEDPFPSMSTIQEEKPWLRRTWSLVRPLLQMPEPVRRLLVVVLTLFDV